VQPEALESETNPKPAASQLCEDPLLQLFYREALSAQDFHEALRQQRGVPMPSAQSATAGAQA
jgi:hypothetical protein